MTRNCPRFDRTATMWRTFCLFSLMLFTFDFPRDSEAVRATAELVRRDDGPNHREERRDVREENSAELVGKWRNNGEALEPIWRDGDAVPLFPFSHFSEFSSQFDESESSEVEDYAAKEPRKGQENFVRSRKNPSTRFFYSGYQDSVLESTPGTHLRKRNRIWINENLREPFQTRANDYEHELNDDEDDNDDDYLKPRPRKRRPPQNDEFVLAENETMDNNRKPLNQPEVSDQENSLKISSRNAAIQLKSLLKTQQEEGLSLSEILQQKNLSLSDLLKGKADAINALRVNKTENYAEEDQDKVKVNNTRNEQELIISIVPISFDSRKNFTNEDVIDSTDGNATIPGERSQEKIVNATKSMELSRADGGERKPIETLDEDEIMEFSDFTDYKKGRSGMSPVWFTTKDGESPVENKNEDKGSTLSIEKILSPTERSKSTFNNSLLIDSRKKEQFVKDEEITRHLENEHHAEISDEKDYQNDEPTVYYDLINNATDKSDFNASKIIMQEIKSAFNAMSRRDNNLTIENHRTTQKNFEENDNLKNHQDTTTLKKSYDEIISEVEPEARAEIFELFASGSAGKRLERLLKSRNMSIDELIALRQRGSSKVHLAQVARIRAQKPNTSSPLKDENRFKNAENREEDTDSMSTSISMNPLLEESTTEQISSNFESMFKKEFDNVPKMEDNGENTKGRHRTVEIVDLLTTFDSLPFAKDIKKDLTDRYDSEKKRIHKEPETVRLNEGFVKEVLKEERNSIDIQTMYSETSNILEDKEKNEKGKTLSKVKPSIIASGAILGLTLVVFLAIFIICRIRQKQKYRYRNTFPRTVFQGPVLTARKLSNSSSLSTVMVNVVATSTTKRPERNETRETTKEIDSRSDIDNDSLDANDSWETIPDYMK